MRFRDIRWVEQAEQAEQKFRRFWVCLEWKQKRVTVIVGLFDYIKAPTKNSKRNYKKIRGEAVFDLVMQTRKYNRVNQKLVDMFGKQEKRSEVI